MQLAAAGEVLQGSAFGFSEVTAGGLSVGIIVPRRRRGPTPRAGGEWLGEVAAILAESCRADGITDPFRLDCEETAKRACFSPHWKGASLRNALHERGLVLAHLHAEAWRLLGTPPPFAN